MGLDMEGLDGKDREVVLGRRTYEIFEPYWPYQAADNPIAQSLNAAKKHVAYAVTALKSEAGLNLQIIGSGNLIQALQAASLIDEYNVWTFPVLLGRGKRLFEAGAKPGALRLVASETSAHRCRDEHLRAGGEISPGSS